MTSSQLIQKYYQAFNDKNREGLLALLSENVVHDINQGARQSGKAAFIKFLDKMDGAYDESLVDIVVMVDSTGTRAAAEFVVLGKYLKTDEGLPAARGQQYRLPAGAFFEIDPKAQQILRVSTHYNLPQWIEMVK